MTVRIEGLGAPTAGYPAGAPLFTDYKTAVELPKEKATKDFEVPASAAARLPANPGPLP